MVCERLTRSVILSDCCIASVLQPVDLPAGGLALAVELGGGLIGVVLDLVAELDQIAADGGGTIGHLQQGDADFGEAGLPALSDFGGGVVGLGDGGLQLDAGLLQSLGQVGGDGAGLRTDEIGLLEPLGDAGLELLPGGGDLAAQIALQRRRVLLEGVVFDAGLLGGDGELIEVVADGVGLAGQFGEFEPGAADLGDLRRLRGGEFLDLFLDLLGAKAGGLSFRPGLVGAGPGFFGGAERFLKDGGGFLADLSGVLHTRLFLGDELAQAELLGMGVSLKFLECLTNLPLDDGVLLLGLVGGLGHLPLQRLDGRAGLMAEGFGFLPGVAQSSGRLAERLGGLFADLPGRFQLRLLGGEKFGDLLAQCGMMPFGALHGLLTAVLFGVGVFFAAAAEFGRLPDGIPCGVLYFIERRAGLGANPANGFYFRGELPVLPDFRELRLGRFETLGQLADGLGHPAHLFLEGFASLNRFGDSDLLDRGNDLRRGGWRGALSKKLAGQRAFRSVSRGRGVAFNELPDDLFDERLIDLGRGLGVRRDQGIVADVVDQSRQALGVAINGVERGVGEDLACFLKPGDAKAVADVPGRRLPVHGREVKAAKEPLVELAHRGVAKRPLQFGLAEDEDLHELGIVGLEIAEQAKFLE